LKLHNQKNKKKKAQRKSGKKAFETYRASPSKALCGSWMFQKQRKRNEWKAYF
jgi:hypothetical protein